MSHELEQQFSVPLPPIVAWNYPTPASLGSLPGRGDARREARRGGRCGHAPNGTTNGANEWHAIRKGADDAELAALLAEVENLSDDEAARLLAEEQQAK